MVVARDDSHLPGNIICMRMHPCWRHCGTICWLSESLAATMNAAVFVMMSGEMRRAEGYFGADESAVGDTAALFSAPSTVNIARL